MEAVNIVAVLYLNARRLDLYIYFDLARHFNIVSVQSWFVLVITVHLSLYVDVDPILSCLCGLLQSPWSFLSNMTIIVSVQKSCFKI